MLTLIDVPRQRHETATATARDTAAAVAAILTRAGWTMRVLPGAVMEFTYGHARVELPRGAGGRCAPTVQRLDDAGGTVWGGVLTASTPARAVVDLAIAAAT